MVDAGCLVPRDGDGRLTGLLACFQALRQEIADGQLPLLKDMYNDWPFFKSTLSLVQMVLAKADPNVSGWLFSL